MDDIRIQGANCSCVTINPKRPQVLKPHWGIVHKEKKCMCASLHKHLAYPCTASHTHTHLSLHLISLTHEIRRQTDMLLILSPFQILLQWFEATGFTKTTVGTGSWGSWQGPWVKVERTSPGPGNAISTASCSWWNERCCHLQTAGVKGLGFWNSVAKRGCLFRDEVTCLSKVVHKSCQLSTRILVSFLYGRPSAFLVPVPWFFSEWPVQP